MEVSPCATQCRVFFLQWPTSDGHCRKQTVHWIASRNLMLSIVESKHWPNTAALMFLFILCSQHLLSLHKYFAGTSCSSLAERVSRVDSQLSFPRVCRIFTVSSTEAELFIFPFPAPSRSLARLQRKKQVWDALQVPSLICFHFTSYGQGKWKWKSYIILTVGPSPEWRDEIT